MSTQVIGFHYTLKDKEGQLIDSSEGQSPLLVLVGSEHIIPGLEKELVTMNVGDKKNVVVSPAEGYGDIVADLQMVVQKSQFPEGTELTIGDRFQVNEDPNAPVFTIVGIENDEVSIDGNHPMAGIDLHFEVEVTDKREATKEEIENGHVFGDEGHQH